MRKGGGGCCVVCVFIKSSGVMEGIHMHFSFLSFVGGLLAE